MIFSHSTPLSFGGAMYCQGDDNCERTDGLPFSIIRKPKETEASAEERVLCPTCIKVFRRVNRKQIQSEQLSVDLNENFRATMREFSGVSFARRRRGRL
jgi:hypothetical protein